MGYVSSCVVRQRTKCMGANRCVPLATPPRSRLATGLNAKMMILVCMQHVMSAYIG